MKNSLLVLFALLNLCLVISVAFAQHSEENTASVPHRLDVVCSPLVYCPPPPTPSPGGGSKPGGGANHYHGSGPPGDADGDGIPDGIDQCPFVGGPSSNQGCPLGSGPALVTPIADTITAVTHSRLSPPPDTKHCYATPAGNLTVNVRADWSITSPVLTLLPPRMYFLVLGIYDTEHGVWILTLPGWVSGSAVRLVGPCADVYHWYWDSIPAHGTRFRS